MKSKYIKNIRALFSLIVMLCMLCTWIHNSEARAVPAQEPCLASKNLSELAQGVGQPCVLPYFLHHADFLIHNCLDGPDSVGSFWCPTQLSKHQEMGLNSPHWGWCGEGCPKQAFYSLYSDCVASVWRYIPSLGRDGQVTEKCAFPWTDVSTGKSYQVCLAGKHGRYWCPTKLAANNTFDPENDPNFGWCEDDPCYFLDSETDEYASWKGRLSSYEYWQMDDFIDEWLLFYKSYDAYGHQSFIRDILGPTYGGNVGYFSYNTVRKDGIQIFEGCDAEEYTVDIGEWLSEVCGGKKFYSDYAGESLEDTEDFSHYLIGFEPSYGSNFEGDSDDDNYGPANLLDTLADDDTDLDEHIFLPPYRPRNTSSRLEIGNPLFLEIIIGCWLFHES